MSKRHENLSFLLLLAAVALSVPLVLGFLGAVHPALDSFSHFRAHLAVLLTVLTVPLLFTKMRREAAMLLLFAVMALSTTIGAARDFLSDSTGAHAQEQGGARYSLVQINLREDNPEPKRLLQMIAREKPDVVTYEEASDQWTMWLTILGAPIPTISIVLTIPTHGAWASCRSGLSAGCADGLRRRWFARNCADQFRWNNRACRSTALFMAMAALAALSTPLHRTGTAEAERPTGRRW